MKLAKKLLVLGVSGALAHGVLAQQSQQPGQERGPSAQSQSSQSQSQQREQGQSSAQQRQSEQPGQSSSAQQRQSQSQQPGQSSQQQQAQQRSSQQQGQQASGQGLQQLSQQHENLSTFVRLMEETGLADTITSGGQRYTAFAPTDEAFEQHGDMEELMRPENRERLVELLRDHLIADEVDAARAGELGQALTVSGRTLTLEEQNGELMVNGTEVEESDIRSGGLIVHIVDEVLEPTGEASVASAQQPGQSGQQSAAGQRQAGSQSQAGQSQAGQSQAGQRQAGQSQAGQGQAGQRQAGQPGQAGERPSFEEVDRNSDGELSRIELARVEGMDFSEVDTNQDGNISRQEYENAAQR